MSRLLDNLLVLSLAVLAGFLATSNSFLFWGIKPNLILSLVVAVTLLRASVFEIILLAVIAAAALTWTPSLSSSLFILLIITAVAIISRRHLSSHLLSVFLISFTATFFWYFVSDLNFVVNFMSNVFIEGIINGVFAVILVALGRSLSVFRHYE